MMENEMVKLTATLIIGIAIGVIFTRAGDLQTVREAQRNEMQANGLEDQCKAVLRQRTGFITTIPSGGSFAPVVVTQ